MVDIVGSSRQAGVTYLWTLLAIVLLALGIGHELDVQHQAMQRDREAELLQVGSQYRLAIQSYYEISPGLQKQLPHNLTDLLRDPRLLTLHRHIRRLFADPLNPSGQWGIIRDSDGGIAGIYSLARGVPIKQANFPAGCAFFQGASSYADWRFVFVPGRK